jgi:hypothetical protein
LRILSLPGGQDTGTGVRYNRKRTSAVFNLKSQGKGFVITWESKTRQTLKLEVFNIKGRLLGMNLFEPKNGDNFIGWNSLAPNSMRKAAGFYLVKITAPDGGIEKRIYHFAEL